jgi:hypothetical protein
MTQNTVTTLVTSKGSATLPNAGKDRKKIEKKMTAGRWTSGFSSWRQKRKNARTIKKAHQRFSFLRGSNYSPTVPSSRIRLPKHFSSAYALDE